MRTLVLISANFPFGTRESFLDTEFPFLFKAFERTIIISLNETSDQKRSIPEHVILYKYRTTTSLSGYLHLPILFLGHLSIITTIYREETAFRNNSGMSLSVKRKLFLLKKIIKALQLKVFIESRLKEIGVFSEVVFYSYWLNIGAYALGMINYNKSIRISRAHGSDLYEEKTDIFYHPMIKHMAERLDAIFFISEHGEKYFSLKTGGGKSKLKLSRLGVLGPEYLRTERTGNGPFTIVSCSNVIKIKRIDLIINALSLLESLREIRWIHFGDGMMREDLENMASGLLGKNNKVKYEFRGYIPNKEILEFYTTNEIHLFLNTSSTEGVPVSIMEAQSFGIPVIATDIGGVSEIVIEGTGYLLPVNFKPEELAERIKQFMNMEPTEERKFRESAFMNWNQKFNAAVNYPEFIRIVSSIFEKSIKENS